MITLSRKSIDRSLTVFSTAVIVMSIVLFILTLKVSRNLKAAERGLAMANDKVGKLNEDNWLFSAQYDVWLANTQEASDFTNDLIKKNTASERYKAIQYSLQRPNKESIIVYYVTDNVNGFDQETSSKNNRLTAERKATIDSVINKRLRNRVDPANQTVIITDQVASGLIDSTKDTPIKKVASITTPAESTTAVKGRDVKVVEYN